MVSQTESKPFLRSSHCYFPTHNRLHFTGAWNGLSAMYDRQCNPLIQHRAGPCACAPLPSDERHLNGSDYHLIPHHSAFGETPPLQGSSRAALLPIWASKQPRCETTNATWKNWAGKLFWWKTEIVSQWSLCNKVFYFLANYRSGWKFPF